MKEILEFPKLGIKFMLDQTAFTIGNIGIRWYGICIAAGFVLALFYFAKKAKSYGVVFDSAIDAIIAGTFGAVIGARLYYVIFSYSEYKDNFIDVFKIWNGGIAIYGAIIGAVIGGYIGCRLAKLKILPMFDLAALGFLIGQGIGRWGNFFNIEAFGSNTNLPWGMKSQSTMEFLASKRDTLAEAGIVVIPNLPVHPTFLYESIWCIIGFVLLHIYSKNRKFDGEIALLYVGWYGLGRAFIEGLRTDSLMMGSVRVSQILAILLVIASSIIWFLITRKLKKGEIDLPLYVTTNESKLKLFDYEKKMKKERIKKNEKKQSKEKNDGEDN
jgi:phosphatidylglycerol:prolipoprotein diacylglycerol transferase